MFGKIVLLVALLAALLAFGVAVALAQEETPLITETVVAAPTDAPTPVVVVTPTPEPTPVPDPQPGDDAPITTPGDLFNQFVQLLGGTYIAWAATGVVILTGLFKALAWVIFKTPIEGTAAVLLSLVFQVAIWIVYSIAAAAGQGDVFKEWYLRVIDLGRALLPLFGALFVSKLGYTYAAKYDVPVAGFKPPKRPNMIRG